MELKFFLNDEYIYEYPRSNRTFMELKSNKGTRYTTGSTF